MSSTRVHVAVFDSLADWEIGYATAHIRKTSWQREPGRYEIVTVGTNTNPITTMGGLRIVPDTTLDELHPEDSAMLILAGGEHWAEPEMDGFRTVARHFVEAGVPVAAICGATYGLAMEGLLDDRPHTSNAAEFLAQSGYAGGALFRDQPAVDADGLITATGVAPVHFAKAIFDRLELYPALVSDSWFKLYGERDPQGYFELMSA